ncbi:MAG: histidine kinase, partial [Pseudomonadota bacterium]|nr:histidine kinase [Pseudomonadota bacterium]
MFIASLMLGALIADEAVARGANRRPTYLVALIVASALAAWANNAINQRVGWAEVLFDGVPSRPDAWREASFFFAALLFGGFGYSVHVNQRTARLAAARMRKAELARALARRRTLESRLQAMQARIEPQFLFNTLAQVGELYERDPAIAGSMLDDLILYLRAALPH